MTVTTLPTQAAPAETRLIGGKAMTFKQYKAAVNAEVFGLLDDLTDYDLISEWEAGKLPKEAARNVLEFDGTASDELMDELFDDEDY